MDQTWSIPKPFPFSSFCRMTKFAPLYIFKLSIEILLALKAMLIKFSLHQNHTNGILQFTRWRHQSEAVAKPLRHLRPLCKTSKTMGPNTTHGFSNHASSLHFHFQLDPVVHISMT